MAKGRKQSPGSAPWCFPSRICNHPDASRTDWHSSVWSWEGRWDPVPSLLPHPSLSACLSVPQLIGLQTGLHLQNRPPSPSTLALTFLFQQKPNSFKANLIEIQKLFRASALLSTPPHIGGRLPTHPPTNLPTPHHPPSNV